jgi:hypothetical protein
MSAHWVVLAAAALTTLIAAAVGAALAVFAGQALPQAVRHDLVVAPGTSMSVSGTFAGGSVAQTSAALRSTIAGTLDGVGLGERQRAWVVALEVLPAVIAAAVAAWACAVTLPRTLAPDINLSVFTGSSVPVPLAANVVSVAVPILGLALVAATSLGIEIRWGRRRGAASLRVGE